MISRDLNGEIAELEQRRKDLSRRIVHSYDTDELEKLTTALIATKERLGRLLLARDKQQRPEIYR